MKNTRKPGEGGRKPFKGGDRSSDTAGKPEGRSPVKRSFSSAEGKSPARKSFSAKPREIREKNPDHIAVTGDGERISKIMARAGVASRRDCERMILESRVRLNGKVLDTPAVNCTPSDVIEVDGQQIGSIERTRLWIYYKPAGLVTTNYDPEGRPTVFDNLPPELPRVISVGRLDINTEGLLMLTNDGGLARMLELPTTGWLRRYRVRAHGEIDQEKLDSLKDGIAVDGIFYGAIEATLDRAQGHNVWITMGLREGKNREIKNVLGALGLDVNRLIRISYGPFQLGELEDGQVVEVKSRTLRDQLGPRLIAEANANFEAPIHDPVVNDEEEKAAPAKREWSAGQREARGERRERDLSRIDTKRPERGERPVRGERADRNDRPRERSRDRDDDRKSAGAPRGRERDRDAGPEKKKRPPLGTIRTTNVWMAPGARPVAVKKTRDETAEATPKRRVLRLRKDGADVVASPPPAKEGRARRPAAKTFAGKRGEAGADGARARPERSFAGKRSEGGRPEERSEGKPRGEKPFGDRKRDGEARPKSFAGRPERAGNPDRNGPGNGPRKDGPRKDGPRKDGPRGDGPRGDGPGRGGPGGKGMKSGADRRR
ncbi:MAG: Pseudouridylate synthase [Rhizobium sp.]|nr:Pseudouridylate synthase [Rhizobium sp.]